jgi:hypothetical protein
MKLKKENFEHPPDIWTVSSAKLQMVRFINHGEHI